MDFKSLVLLACSLIVTNLNGEALYSTSGKPLAENIALHLEEAKKLRGSCALLVTSDSGRKNAGEWAADVFEADGYELIALVVIPNDQEKVHAYLKEWIDQGVECIVTMGGTGFSPRDTTFDVAQTFIEKALPGFGELFRLKTHQEWGHLDQQIGELALLTRATAGKAKGSFLFILPGSLDAVQTGVDIILSTLPVLLSERLKDQQHLP